MAVTGLFKTQLICCIPTGTCGSSRKYPLHGKCIDRPEKVNECEISQKDKKKKQSKTTKSRKFSKPEAGLKYVLLSCVSHFVFNLEKPLR